MTGGQTLWISQEEWNEGKCLLFQGYNSQSHMLLQYVPAGKCFFFFLEKEGKNSISLNKNTQKKQMEKVEKKGVGRKDMMEHKREQRERERERERKGKNVEFKLKRNKWTN